MPRINKSKYAVLGILSLGPMSGYEIKNTIEGSLGNFWSESYGQIYPILRSLVAEGLATSRTEEQTGRPNRHVYTLTDAGRGALLQWLAEPVEYDVGRVEILLKLFFGWQLPVEDSLTKLREFRTVSEGLGSKYEGIEQWLKSTQAGHPGLPYWLATVSYGQHLSRALLAWCDETEGILGAIQEDQGHRAEVATPGRNGNGRDS